MKLPNLEFFQALKAGDPMPDGFGARLAQTLRAIATQSTTTERQANVNPAGQPEPPPSVNGINITAANGHHSVTITDQNAGVKRGVNYWLERDTSPQFTNPHVIDLGQSRNHSEFLGNGEYYWRAYSSYPSSAPSSPVYHGSAVQPTPVSAGGDIGSPAPIESQGSGTGAPRQGLVGPGLTPERTEATASAWKGQGETSDSRFAVTPALFGADGSGSGGGGGGVSITEAAIASCEWLGSVTGTNTVTATTSVPYSALSNGFLVRFIPANTNSSAVTLNINGIGAKAVTKNGTTALAGGELVAAKAYLLLYDGTRWQVIGVIAPASATVLSSDANGVPTAAALANTKVWIGSAGNLPVEQVLSGAIAVSAAGVTTTAASGVVTPGSYTNANITVTADGIVTAAANGSSGSGSTGSFTPGVQFGSGTTGITYGSQTGTYFKISNMVFAYFDLTLTSKGSSTGFAEVTGLPFASSATFIAGGTLSYLENMTGLTATPSVLASVGTTNARLLDFSATDGTNITDTNFTNTTRIVGLAIYYS